MKSNIFLANIVYLSHLLLILFIIYGPFTSNPLILLLHIVSCICLLFHWYMNSDLCSLNILEAKLRNIKISQTITYQDSTKGWLSYVEDNTANFPTNWIRNGVNFTIDGALCDNSIPYINPCNFPDEAEVEKWFFELIYQ